MEYRFEYNERVIFHLAELSEERKPDWNVIMEKIPLSVANEFVEHFLMNLEQRKYYSWQNVQKMLHEFLSCS